MPEPSTAQDPEALKDFSKKSGIYPYEFYPAMDSHNIGGAIDVFKLLVAFKEVSDELAQLRKIVNERLPQPPMKWQEAEHGS